MSHASAQGRASVRRGWPARVFEFFAEQWKSVFFSAAVALILEHVGVLAVFTKVSWLVVSSLASQGPAEPVTVGPGTPTVVLIDNTDFVERYGERNPLDRCLLAEDITRVLSKQPRRLAIDFDLSPLLHAREGERVCQQRLDALLDQYADRLVVLAPFPPALPALREAKHAWMQARCAAGVHFGDGSLTRSLGMVTEQIVGDAPAQRARLAEQLNDGLSTWVCEQVTHASDAAHNPWLRPEGAAVEAEEEGHGGHSTAHESHEPESAPLNFPAATRSLALVPLRGEAFDALPALNDNPVLLGGDWGRDDSFLTSIGTLPGAALHGVRVVSLRHPVKAPSAWLGLLSDVGIALCFAWVVHRFWFGYVHARRFDLRVHERPAPTPRVALGSLFMATFVLIYLSLAVYFVFAAQFVFVHHGLVLAPLLISISILVDGFISGPVEQIQELLEEANHAHAAQAEARAWPEALWSLLNHVRWVYLLLLALAVAWLLGVLDGATLAGWSFLAAQAVLYGALVVHVGVSVWTWLRLPLHERRAGLQRLKAVVCHELVWLPQLLRQGAQGLWAVLCLTFGRWTPSRPPAVSRLESAAQLLAAVRAVVFWAALGYAAWLLMH